MSAPLASDEIDPTAVPYDQMPIWEHAQNENLDRFHGGEGRLDFLLGRVAKAAAGPRPDVLNIGVGDARFERAARDRGWAIHSLDPDRAAMERLAGEGIATHAARIEAMPLPDAAFDFVVASEVLEHLTEGQRTAGLTEIARVLRPGGQFWGTVPYEEDLSLRQCLCPSCGLRYHQYGHMASFDFDTVRTMLASHFEGVRTGRSAFVSFAGRGPGGIAKSLIRAGLGRMGQQIAVPRLWWSARKPSA